ncbi:MAG: HEPN domain-containing protein [Deltaproteobacteria bacterium]|nr:HEPN domain-containing protein [Deltaproteobacteria bacterium]
MLNSLDEIRDRIVRSYDPERIILFGSWARGEADETSDVDLLVIKDTAARPLDRRCTVEKILLDRDVPLDLLVYTPAEVRYLYSIGSPFIEDVMETGRVLYMRKATESWVGDSEEELRTAQVLIEHDRFRGVCYHSQQCVEKGLKAAIIEKGSRPEKTHDVLELLKEARNLGFEIPLEMDDAVFLNSIYKGRYPTEEGLLPHGDPSRDDAERALRAADSFFSALRSSFGC